MAKKAKLKTAAEILQETIDRLAAARNRAGKVPLTLEEIHTLRIELRDGLLFWLQSCVVSGTLDSARTLKLVAEVYTYIQNDLRLEAFESAISGNTSSQQYQIFFEPLPETTLLQN